ncbi:MAG: T9SS type A sorting domain-containing protein [Saprospirales bacterium]|nr:T9SS type A sorting domain-containing protein [Saprospirales bacterium]MBK8490777.1 T9SS type A sorting domain-containing protein [Saprospirales bacterium]
MRKLTSLRSFALVVLLWCSVATTYGQVTVYSPPVIGDPGQPVKVLVKVANFTSMLNAQFTLRYDSLILAYSGIGDFGIFNINNQNFGVPAGPFPTHNGVVSFLWIADNIITGQSVADSSVLFSINFDVIGSAGQVSPIQFSNNPTDLEFGNLTGEITYNAYDGAVTVSGGSATEEIVTQDFIFYPVSPNPVREEAQIRFSLEQSSQTTLTVFDISGRVIYQNAQFFRNGAQVYILPEEVFPVSGTYFARLTTEHAQAVQKLVVIR